jgi:membrane associated rhomboid family serine protease
LKATYILIATNIMIWVFITLSISGNEAGLSSLLQTYGVSQASVLNGVNPLPFITYMFVHVDPFHLLLNMSLLLIFGRIVERHLGAAKLLLLYFTSGVGGSLFHASLILFSCPPHVEAVAPECLTPLVGATGAVLGIMVSLHNISTFLFTTFVKPSKPLRFMSVAAPVIAIGLFILASGGRASPFAHLAGGIATGLLLSHLLLWGA